MNPSMAMLIMHLQEAGFQQGMDEGMWGIQNDVGMELPNWPYVFIWIAARDKPGCPNKYYFRFDMTGYPAAPTALPWNMERNERLENDKWPKGKGVIVSSVFNPGWPSLYAPCDRLAMQGHPDWQKEFPDYWWKEGSRIEKYLSFIHTRLQSNDYVQG
jgi:hypothetical protein